jgi:hypothetical protein
MVAGFLASRTVGLPAGYHESFGGGTDNVLGYVTTAAEVLVAVVAARVLPAFARRSGRLAIMRMSPSSDVG